MPLNKMEHYLVLSDDIALTRNFYIDVLELKEGFRPDLGFPGYWLYLNKAPVIHLAEWVTYTLHSEKLGIPVTKKADGTGPFDHIAFNGSGAEEMITKLNSMGISFEHNDVPVASSLLKNVMSAVKTRQKLAKKRSLHVVNEHFEPIYNAGLARVIVFQQAANLIQLFLYDPNGIKIELNYT